MRFWTALTEPSSVLGGAHLRENGLFRAPGSRAETGKPRMHVGILKERRRFTLDGKRTQRWIVLLLICSTLQWKNISRLLGAWRGQD